MLHTAFIKPFIFAFNHLRDDLKRRRMFTCDEVIKILETAHRLKYDQIKIGELQFRTRRKVASVTTK